MNISVIGCGRWGTCIAWYLNKIGKNVVLYGRVGEKDFDRLSATRQNDYMAIPPTLELSSDLNYTIDCADIYVISIPSQGLRSLMNELLPHNLNNKTIILCMKGLEVETGKTLSQIAREYVDPSVKIAIWVGPGHPQDFVNGKPNCMVIDSECQETKEKLINEFSSELIRFYYGSDLIGNEVGAASKNVIGIAAGMLDGLDRTALKGALMSRGTREISRLIKAMGGSEMTAYGLAHLGDYEATVFSKFSHNRYFGECFIGNKNYDQLAEGVYTAKSLMTLSKKYNVELPICQSVYNVIYLKQDPTKALSDIFMRSLKEEF